MRRSSALSSSRWPFWLLIAAWVCANSPQAATYAVLTWLAEARSFTHQERLTRQVAELLGGRPAEGGDALVAAKTEAAPRSKPAVPPDAVLKRQPLSCEQVIGVMPPEWRIAGSAGEARRWPDSCRAPPPHGPPRTGGV